MLLLQMYKPYATCMNMTYCTLLENYVITHKHAVGKCSCAVAILHTKAHVLCCVVESTSSSFSYECRIVSVCGKVG